MHHERALVAAVFPGRTVDRMSVSDAGNSKRTVAVWFEAHPPVVVQYSTESSLRTEGELARAIRKRTAIPVPRVLEIGRSGATSFVVSELARGTNLHGEFTALDAATRRAIAREFGRHLAELHETFTFDGVGGITSTTTDRGVAFRAVGGTDFGAWFREYALEGVDALPEPFDDVRGELRRAVESEAVDSTEQSVLYPWDFRPGNALASDGALSAVLDWGDPLAASAGLSVAKTEHLVADWYVSDPEPLRRAFRRGYETVRAYPAVPPIYRLVAVTRSAVDSKGVVTRPRYPEWTGQRAVEFHLGRLRRLVGACDPA